MNAPVYRRPLSSQIDDPGADFGEALRRLDPLSAKAFVDFDLSATTATQYVPHTLGVAYRGAILVGQTAANTVRIFHPRVSPDATKRIGVAQSTAVAQTIRLLVF